MLLDPCPPNPIQQVNYPVINGSIDYIELSASFFGLKVTSESCGHFSFPLSSKSQQVSRHFLFCFFKIYLFYLFLFLAVLGLRCCARAFSSCDEQGLLFIVVRRLLIPVASLAEHGF